MGCGGSKFDPERKMIQSAGIHTSLKHRIIDQIRRRNRDSLKDTTMSHSTNQLLRYKINDGNSNKDRSSSVSNISFTTDRDDNASTNNGKFSTPPSKPNSPDNNNNNNENNTDDKPGLSKPTCNEHHKQTSSLENVNREDIKISADTATTTATTTTTTTTATPAFEEKLHHNHNDKDTVIGSNNNANNLPVTLVAENKAAIIYHQKVDNDNADQHQDKSAVAAAAAAAEKDRKDQNDEYLLWEEEADEVVVVVVDEQREDPSSVYPGSPSFRVYCINSSIISDDEEYAHDDNDQYKGDDATQMKTESDKSGGTLESANSNQGQESVRKTKNAHWKKMRRIKKKMGGRGKRSVKVRQLLSVKSCYNPATACSGGNDRARLLTAHKQATVPSS